MRIFANDPLTDAELDRLGEFLKGCAGGKAMNVEELDGFFAALVACPEVVMTGEYLPEVFGDEMSDAHEFGSLEEAKNVLALLCGTGTQAMISLERRESFHGPTGIGAFTFSSHHTSKGIDREDRRITDEHSTDSWTFRDSLHAVYGQGTTSSHS
jgi:hypothetical protein